jgi:hypothetical protein
VPLPFTTRQKFFDFCHGENGEQFLGIFATGKIPHLVDGKGGKNGEDS